MAVVVLQRKGTFSPELADYLNELAMSAGPYAPLTLYSRVEYLLLSGRWETESAEIEMLVARLQRHAALQPVTWLVAGEYALELGDMERARAAVEVGLKTDGPELEMAALRRLKERL